MKRPKRIGSYASESEYSKGYTPLNKEQKAIFLRLTQVLEYTNGEYDDFPDKYAPDGLILVLRNQLTAKLQNGGINESECEKVSNLINLLERELDL